MLPISYKLLKNGNVNKYCPRNVERTWLVFARCSCTENEGSQLDTDKDNMYLCSASFNEPCAIVQKRIVLDQELLRLTTLKQMFVEIAMRN